MWTSILVIIFVGKTISANDEPSECSNFIDLVEVGNGAKNEHRHLLYKDLKFKSIDNDRTEDFHNKWFRFSITNADRMLERRDLPREIPFRPTSFRDRSNFRPCGTDQRQARKQNPKNGRFSVTTVSSWFYVLNDFHTMSKYGFMSTFATPCVYYKAPGTFQTCSIRRPCIYKPICLQGGNYAVPIVVRNCGDFFVYKTLAKIPDAQIDEYAAEDNTKVTFFPPGTRLSPGPQKPGIFCGTKDKLHNDTICERSSDHYVVDDERGWNWNAPLITSPITHNTTGNEVKCNDDRHFIQDTWVRFQTKNNQTMRLAENCPSVVKNREDLFKTSYCGAQYRGWVQGNHPTVEEGRTVHKICFSLASNCECELSTEITILNCGEFYLYRRRPKDFPHCLARACTVPDERGITIQSSSIMSSSIIPSTSNTAPSTSSMMLNSTADAEVMLNSSETMTSSSSITEMTMSSTSVIKPSTSSSDAASLIIGNNRRRRAVEVSSSSSTTPTPTMKSVSSPMVSSSPMSMYIEANMSSSPSVPMSSSIPITPKNDKPPSLCDNFKTITDDSRLSTFATLSNPRSRECDLSYFQSVRFMTSSGESLRLKEGCSEKDQLQRSCSTFTSNVWLKVNGNPNITGLQVVPICIRQESQNYLPFIADYCKCDREDAIFVERCTDQNEEPFFVYRLYPIFHTPNNDSRMDSKKCAYRYCHELQPGTKPSKIPTFKPVVETQETFGVIGSFVVDNPFIDGLPLSEKHIADNTSETYLFLVKIMTEQLSLALNSVPGISRISITGFQIGSLVVNYKVHGTDELNNQTVNDNIQKFIQQNPDINTAVGTNSFTGKINPATQKLEGIDLCANDPCHVNATCTNNDDNTYTCKCNDKFDGDGYSCDNVQVVHVKVTEIEVDNEWSNDSIIIVSVLFAVCFVIIVILMFFLCCRHTGGYNTKKGIFNRTTNNYDNYYTTDAPMKEKGAIVPTAQNMYMSSDIDMNDTTTFSDNQENQKGKSNAGYANAK